MNIKQILQNEGYVFKHYESVHSTMDTIKELFNYNKNKLFILADKQVEGKGRRGSFWHSPKGNVYLSFSLEMLIDIKDHFIINAAVALTIAKTIDYICNVSSKIKWPNDIMVNGKKISGLMTEIIKQKNTNYIIIGVGINVDSSPIISKYPTTFTKEINSSFEKINIIELFILNFFKKYNKIEYSVYDSILKEFKKKLLYLNEIIHLQLDRSKFIKGRFEDINLDGSIVININGLKQNLYSARIIDDRK